MATRKTTPPMPRADALANIAYILLSTRGQTDNPTLHEITLAVVQAAPLLDITTEPDAAEIQLAAADELIRRHGWKVGRVVVLKSKVNGHQHTRENAPPRTTTAHPEG